MRILLLALALAGAGGSVSPPQTAAELAGRASWYATPGLTGAAGPALRAALGRDWRGQRVRVLAGDRAVTVRLTDWCQCYRGESTERLIDLSDGAFRELAPLSRGLVRVRILLELEPAEVRVVPPTPAPRVSPPIVREHGACNLHGAVVKSGT